MTERERELLGYVSELLSLSRNETRWPRQREIWNRIADATVEDRAALRQEWLEANFIRRGDAWVSRNGRVSVSA